MLFAVVRRSAVSCSLRSPASRHVPALLPTARADSLTAMARHRTVVALSLLAVLPLSASALPRPRSTARSLAAPARLEARQFLCGLLGTCDTTTTAAAAASAAQQTPAADSAVPAASSATATSAAATAPGATSATATEAVSVPQVGATSSSTSAAVPAADTTTSAAPTPTSETSAAPSPTSTSTLSTRASAFHSSLCVRMCS